MGKNRNQNEYPGRELTFDDIMKKKESEHFQGTVNALKYLAYTIWIIGFFATIGIGVDNVGTPQFGGAIVTFFGSVISGLLFYTASDIVALLHRIARNTDAMPHTYRPPIRRIDYNTEKQQPPQ